MRLFTQLFEDLDRTTRTSEKVAAMERYFAAAPAADAVWTLFILSGNRLMRAVPSPRLRTWVAEEAGMPSWMLDECYDAVGDQSETFSLLLPDPPEASALPLHRVIEERLLPLATLDEQQQRALLTQSWREFDRAQRFLLHKLISGNFRVGVQRAMVVRAFANFANKDVAVIEHRLMGHWRPSTEFYDQLLAAADDSKDPARPYPFQLAHPLQQPLTALGDFSSWRIEWKWDGIRAQLIRRAGQGIIWSRGEEIVNAQFPEIVDASECLSDGTVLDGEILAWEQDRPLPFAALQRRLNRKRVERQLFPECPVVFIAFDLLEHEGADMRDHPLGDRLAALQRLLSATDSHLRLPPMVPADSWDGVAVAREAARDRGAEGLMLKRRDSRYTAGRTRGEWWKWKVEPFHVDAVLIAAQPGSGKRASLFTDYTFGIWKNGELVPIAKAYSGLTDEEIREVDRFVRRNTLERAGPVRLLKPELVFELAFERVQKSARHKAGLAVRFPRIARWRTDKKPADADTLEMMQALLAQQDAGA